jgi:hypothetical protein
LTVRTSPPFDHLEAMTDRFGTFEHADHSTPRREHGYCVDDVARVLVVSAREPDHSAQVGRLATGALAFIKESQLGSGAVRNRRASDGCWTSRALVEDSWGRSLWGLGTAASSGHASIDAEALTLFERGALLRSPWSRSMAFASLGAAAVLEVDTLNPVALGLLSDAADAMDDRADDSGWPWPEPRLAYANALLPDAMMAVGSALARGDLVRRGLDLLGWLLARETVGGHLSVTPVGGAGPGDVGPGFDQQPIEVATMADACARAATLDDSMRWREGIEMALAWFEGDNDTKTVMWDPATGGGFDGLAATYVNLNMGAESTLAVIATRQQARAHRLVPA